MNPTTEIRLARQQRDAERRDDLARENRRFVQIYPKGFRRLQMLIRDQPSAARLYALLAEHIDPQGGVVVASQAVLAEMLGVTDRTIRTLTKVLEDQKAIVRIRVGTGTYAYALDPDEVWRAWDVQKDHAVFRTKTLVSKGGENASIKRRIQVLISEQQGAPELPFDDYDLETGEVYSTTEIKSGCL
jgi:DNA-binding Lrp family transcriptional regulator